MSNPYDPLRHWASRPHWATFHPQDQKYFLDGLAEARFLPGFTLDGLESFIRSETNPSELSWSTKDREAVICKYMALARKLCSDG